jgi:hypothetical protein
VKEFFRSNRYLFLELFRPGFGDYFLTIHGNSVALLDVLVKKHAHAGSTNGRFAHLKRRQSALHLVLAGLALERLQEDFPTKNFVYRLNETDRRLDGTHGGNQPVKEG